MWIVAWLALTALAAADERAVCRSFWSTPRAASGVALRIDASGGISSVGVDVITVIPHGHGRGVVRLNDEEHPFTGLCVPSDDSTDVRILVSFLNDARSHVWDFSNDVLVFNVVLDFDEYKLVGSFDTSAAMVARACVADVLPVHSVELEAQVTSYFPFDDLKTREDTRTDLVAYRKLSQVACAVAVEKQVYTQRRGRAYQLSQTTIMPGYATAAGRYRLFDDAHGGGVDVVEVRNGRTLFAHVDFDGVVARAYSNFPVDLRARKFEGSFAVNASAVDVGGDVVIQDEWKTSPNVVLVDVVKEGAQFEVAAACVAAHAGDGEFLVGRVDLGLDYLGMLYVDGTSASLVASKSGKASIVAVGRERDATRALAIGLSVAGSLALFVFAAFFASL